MSIQICRRSFSTLNKCRALLNAQLMQRMQPTNQKWLPNLTQQISYFSNKSDDAFNDERPKLGLRRQNLPPFPTIDCVRNLDVKNYLPNSYKTVKYGELEFLERFDGYCCMFICGYIKPHEIDVMAGYSVYFGENHPLNSQGGVERRQSLNHAVLYAMLKGLEQIPTDSLKKLSIMTNQLGLIGFIDRSLRQMSDNSFRSTISGKLNKDLQTCMQINKILRTRNDIQFQLMMCPSDIGVDGMYYAKKIAEKSAAQATMKAKKQKWSHSNGAE